MLKWCCSSMPASLRAKLKLDFSLQKHEIPTSAIPCLAYKKQLEKESQEAELSVEPKEISPEAANETENAFISLDSGNNNSESK